MGLHSGTYYSHIICLLRILFTYFYHINYILFLYYLHITSKHALSPVIFGAPTKSPSHLRNLSYKTTLKEQNIPLKGWQKVIRIIQNAGKRVIWYLMWCFLRPGEETVKVTFKHSILYDSVFFKFTFCKGFGNLMHDPAGIMKDLMLIEFQKAVQPL